MFEALIAAVSMVHIWIPLSIILLLVGRYWGIVFFVGISSLICMLLNGWFQGFGEDLNMFAPAGFLPIFNITYFGVVGALGFVLYYLHQFGDQRHKKQTEHWTENNSTENSQTANSSDIADNDNEGNSGDD